MALVVRRDGRVRAGGSALSSRGLPIVEDRAFLIQAAVARKRDFQDSLPRTAPNRWIGLLHELLVS